MEAQVARLEERIDFLVETLQEVKTDVKTLMQAQSRCEKHEDRLSNLEMDKKKSLSFVTALVISIASSVFSFTGGFVLALFRKHLGV